MHDRGCGPCIHHAGQAAQGDPEVILYRVSGVIDDTAQFATVFFCTNFSGVPETLRVAVRGPTGALLANVAVTVNHLNTTALATHDTFSLTEVNLNTGVFTHGTAAMAATTVNMTCSARQFSAGNANPQGIGLHMTRFNPIAGTQE